MREILYLLPVPLLEALELPITVERANPQKPHAEYDTPPNVTLSRYAGIIVHIHKGIYCLLHP